MSSSADKSYRSYILPGLCDVHVHLREPGFSFKETIASGSAAAAAGGYTTVCSMPNLDPVPDSIEGLMVQEERIRETAAIEVLPYGAITRGEKGMSLSDMDAIAPRVIAFSDDGKGVMSDSLMREAMQNAARLGRIIAAHCEDESFPKWSRESEYMQIARDIRLAQETGCSYHVCHISCRESVDIIRKAKNAGIDVTCETAPHYLLLDEGDVKDEGRFKMNPSIKNADDRKALVEALSDGTIDMIATDHAPHTAAEKSGGFEKSLSGIVGIETALPLLYTYLVKKGVISMDRLTELMSAAPRKRFGIEQHADDYSVWDLEEEYTIDPGSFLSMGRSTPFEGMKVYGRCLRTVFRGKEVYSNGKKN